MYKYTLIIIILVSKTLIVGQNYQIKLPVTTVVDYKDTKFSLQTLYWQNFSRSKQINFSTSLTEQVFDNTAYNQPYLFANKLSAAAYSAVVIDGVKMIDPSNSQLYFDIGQIDNNIVDTIDIIDSNLSTRYGSGASFGVLFINSKQFNKNYSSVSLVTGYPKYYKISASQNFNFSNFNILFMVSANRVQQISLAKYDTFKNKSKELDLTKTLDYGAKLTYKNDSTDISVFYYNNVAKINFDDFGIIQGFGAAPVDSSLEYVNKQNTIAYAILKKRFKLYDYNISILNNSIKRNYPNSQYLSQYYGRQYDFNFDNNINISNLNINFGINNSIQDSSNNKDNYVDIYNNYYYLINKTTLHYGYRFNKLTSKKSKLQKANNVGLNINFKSNYNFIVNAGTGYRNPSIYEHINTSSELDNEQSNTIDTGLKYNNDVFSWFNKIFVVNTKDLISYNSLNNSYYNANKQLSNSGVDAGFEYTLQNKYIFTAGYKRYLKKSPNVVNSGQATVAVNYNNFFSNSVSLIFYDNKQECLGSNCNNLAGYVYFNYKLQYQNNINKYKYNIFIKVNNVLNKQYATNYLYNTAPLSVYFGLQIVSF